MTRPRWLHIMAMLIAIPGLAHAQAGPAPADPHQQLDRILHGPMYTAWQLRQSGTLPDIPDQSLQGWLTHMSDKIGGWIGDFVKWMFPPRRLGGPFASGGVNLPAILKGLAWLIGTIAVLVLLFLVIKMSSRFKSDVPAPHILSREQIQQAMDSGDALALGTAQWMDEAQRLAVEQNFRAVYRALYLALLSGLHIAGKIEHNRNRTNWTYVQHFRGPEQERSTFGELTDLFDRVWYGRKAAESRNLDELRRTVAALVGGSKA